MSEDDYDELLLKASISVKAYSKTICVFVPCTEGPDESLWIEPKVARAWAKALILAADKIDEARESSA